MWRPTARQWDELVASLRSQTGIPIVYIEQLLKALQGHGWGPGHITLQELIDCKHPVEFVTNRKLASDPDGMPALMCRRCGATNAFNAAIQEWVPSALVEELRKVIR